MQALSEKWEKEKEALASVVRLKEEMERVGVEAAAAEREADLGRAAELKYGTLPRLRAQLAENESALADREVCFIDAYFSAWGCGWLSLHKYINSFSSLTHQTRQSPCHF